MEWNLETLRNLLELGWPALVTVFLVILYRDYRALFREYLNVFMKLDTIASMLREVTLLLRSTKPPGTE